VARVRGEHSWPNDRRLKTGGGEQALDFHMEIAHGIGLLKERVRRLMWCGEIHDAPRLRRESGDDGWSGRWRRGPNEEHGLGTVECRVERRGDGEVACHDLDFRG
jgi:hypothetical protein